jgi:fructokinase
MENPHPNPDLPVRIATAGEALIDLISQPDGRLEPCLGGAVFNLTRAIARQGVGVAYLNPLSGDRFGRQLAQALVSDGVHLARPQPVPASTSLAVVAVDAAGHPDYAFYRQGVADRDTDAGQLGRACLTLPALELVCTGCLALSPEDSATYLPWLQAQRARGCTVVVDANLRPSVMTDLSAYRGNVRAALQLADLIKASDEDLENLGVPGADALEKATCLLQTTSARFFVLTLGPKGACLIARDGATWQAVETAPVAVVDTVGAGDCFLAGLLVAWLRQPAPARAPRVALGDVQVRDLLAHAVASATLCVMRRGAAPPTAAEVQARVARAPAQIERLRASGGLRAK